MTRFLIHTTGLKPLLAIAAVHGLTDLDSATWLPSYALFTLMPLPSPVVTGLFCLSSVVHFAEDVGTCGSLLLHAGIALVGHVNGIQSAFRSMICYLSLCHVPMHYRRCYLRKRNRAAVFTGCVTALVVGFSATMHEWVPLTDGMQRIATAHIFTEIAIALGPIKM